VLSCGSQVEHWHMNLHNFNDKGHQNSSKQSAGRQTELAMMIIK